MESIDSINNQLIDLYGIDTVTGIPIWRIVWSDDQREHRKVAITPSGVHLLHPMVFELAKYPYIKERYVLERLVIVPEQHQDELPASKLSYEPMFVFQRPDGSYLPPILPATKFIVDTVYAAMGKVSLAKYTEDNSEEARHERVRDLQEQLFGNETDVGDALAYKEGIVVPGKGES